MDSSDSDLFLKILTALIHVTPLLPVKEPQLSLDHPLHAYCKKPRERSAYNLVATVSVAGKFIIHSLGGNTRLVENSIPDRRP